MEHLSRKMGQLEHLSRNGLVRIEGNKPSNASTLGEGRSSQRNRRRGAYKQAGAEAVEATRVLRRV